MLRALRRLFEGETEAETETGADGREDPEHDVQLATAVLLVEVVQADLKVEEAEREAVRRAVRRLFALSPEESDELIALAERKADESSSLYEHTRLIDQWFSRKRKKKVVELLWRVAFSDGVLEMHEEHLIRQVAKLIHVEHHDFIDAKLRARARFDSGTE